MCKLHAMETIDKIFAKNKGYLTSKLIREIERFTISWKLCWKTEKSGSDKARVVSSSWFCRRSQLGRSMQNSTSSGNLSFFCMEVLWTIYSNTNRNSYSHTGKKQSSFALIILLLNCIIGTKSFMKQELWKTTFNKEEITIYDIEKSVCDAISLPQTSGNRHNFRSVEKLPKKKRP